MFEKKKTVIYFSRKRVRAARVILGRVPRIEKQVDYDWTPETLPTIFSDIRKQFGNKVRILLSDAFVYTVQVLFAGEGIVNYETVSRKVCDSIPENLKQTLWDFQEIGGSDGKWVQVVALVKSFYDVLDSAVRGATLRVEAIEPVSFALNRLISEPNGALLLLHADFVKEIVLVNSGFVVAAVETDVVDLQNTGRFIDQVKQSYGLAVQKILLQTNLDIDSKQLETKERVSERKDMDPVIGLAVKEDIKEKSDRVLDLSLRGEKRVIRKEIPVKEGSRQDGHVQQAGQNVPSKKGWKAVFVIGIIIGVAVVTGFFVIRRWYISPSFPTPPSTSQAPSEVLPEPTGIEEVASASALANEEKEASLSATEIAQYSIEVLNGSGKAGEAKRVGDYLQGNGFTVSNTGNAPIPNQGATIVKTKKELDKRYAELLIDKSLKTLYSDIREESEPDQQYDIVIITGR